MLVAASTECFGQLPLDDAINRLADLEFSNIEIAVRENGNHLRPSEVEAHFDRAVTLCRDTHRLDVVAYDVDIAATGDEYYRQFRTICKLAKATKVVTLTVPSGELGTPFNEEVERLRRLVDFAAMEGARVGLKSQIGRLSEDPDTTIVLCDNVKGLGVTLDPSHYLCGPHSHRSLDKLIKYVYHVHLRDSTKQELQVRIGQGEIDYGRLVAQLRQVGYDRSLCVNMVEIPDVEHVGELRKMRLLLESLI